MMDSPKHPANVCRIHRTLSSASQSFCSRRRSDQRLSVDGELRPGGSSAASSLLSPRRNDADTEEGRQEISSAAHRSKGRPRRLLETEGEVEDIMVCGSCVGSATVRFGCNRTLLGRIPCFFCCARTMLCSEKQRERERERQ